MKLERIFSSALHPSCLLAAVVLLAVNVNLLADDRWVTYDGFEGPGKGKHVVLISGDEEYRSEEGLPQLGKILAKHHGFKCTVLFALDENGTINPNNGRNIPGLEALDSADLMIILTRFRNLPDAQMKHIDDYLRAGKPVIGLRTSTHAFNIPGNQTYAHYGNGYGGEKKEWKDGFGRLVLGEKWISHHGGHKHESTRGVINEAMKDHPILRGCDDIWGDTDVYGVRLPMPESCQTLVFGQVLKGMSPSDPPVEGKKNDPMMPVAWIKSFQLPAGKPGQAFTTTMGSSTDLRSEGLRRLIVNAAYWLT
ncbi:MAG: ThuA domain-containing protein, partial [Planctomycetales bacterium]|nr:ThuA domain-containing protein [Planctomycetales bacterium]